MAISLTNVTKVYKMEGREVRALDGISVDIAAGEFTAITGPAGSGKSTLLSVLGCLERPTTGSYKIDGQEVGTLGGNVLVAARNRKIGFVFQKFNLLPRMSILQNVSLPLVFAGIARQERYERAAQALKLVGLGECTRHRPNELSDGQRQQVVIARTLVNDPGIVLADEPTKNLDIQSSTEIMNIFGEISRLGRTVILVTPEPGIACQARRVIAVRDGRIVHDERSRL